MVFSPVWTRLWFLRSELWKATYRDHTGFSPVWIILCCLRLKQLLNTFLHRGHSQNLPLLWMWPCAVGMTLDYVIFHTVCWHYVSFLSELMNVEISRRNFISQISASSRILARVRNLFGGEKEIWGCYWFAHVQVDTHFPYVHPRTSAQNSLSG